MLCNITYSSFTGITLYLLDSYNLQLIQTEGKLNRFDGFVKNFISSLRVRPPDSSLTHKRLALSQSNSIIKKKCNSPHHKTMCPVVQRVHSTEEQRSPSRRHCRRPSRHRSLSLDETHHTASDGLNISGRLRE